MAACHCHALSDQHQNNVKTKLNVVAYSLLQSWRQHDCFSLQQLHHQVHLRVVRNCFCFYYADSASFPHPSHATLPSIMYVKCTSSPFTSCSYFPDPWLDICKCRASSRKNLIHADDGRLKKVFTRTQNMRKIERKHFMQQRRDFDY